MNTLTDLQVKVARVPRMIFRAWRAHGMWAEIIVCLLTLRFVRIGKHVRFPEIVACAVGGEF